MLPASLLFTFCLLFQTTHAATPLIFGAHQELVQQTFDFTNNQNVQFSFPPSPYQSITPGIKGLKTTPTTVYRPRSVEALHQTRLRSLLHKESELEPLVWDRLEVNGPDVNDLHTLAQLARMSGNAYALRGRSNWYDVDPAWNTVRLAGHRSDLIMLIPCSCSRVFRLGGKSLTVFVDTYSSPQTTLPSCSPSREQQSVGRLRDWINSTTTCKLLCIRGVTGHLLTDSAQAILMLLCSGRLLLGIPHCVRLLQRALDLR